MASGARGRRPRRPALLTVVLLAATGLAAAPPQPALDDMQRAVIDSLASTPRDTPAQLLEATIRVAAIDVPDVAVAYFRRLGQAIGDAGEGRVELLADLGDAFSSADLAGLERNLRDHEPAVGRLVAAIRDAAAARRRDPQRLARAAAALAADSAAERRAATEQLAAAGTAALPALVEILQADDAAQARTRDLARGLVRDLGPEARQPLLAWLGTGDIGHWRGIIDALQASGAEDVETFLLAPALVADTPPAVRAAAVEALAERGRRRGDAAAGAALPTPGAAAKALARRLDRTLSPAGLPPAERLAAEPVIDSRTAAAAFAGPTPGLVERFVWDGQAGRLVRLWLPPRAARAQEAMHVARDMMALGPPNPAAVRLALLARLEELLVLAGDPATAVERIDPAALREAVTGPDGFADTTVAEILDLAIERGMREAAAGAATVLGRQAAAGAGDTRAGDEPLSPAVRDAVLRAVEVPDDALQFAAARTLALRAGPPAYRGSSRVVEVLLRAATSRGLDRAVVAHPVLAEAQDLAAGVSRFGYEPVIVSSGRDAVLAVRESADVTLVILAARTSRPSALETVQFLHAAPPAAPPVLVAIDILDDDDRGCFVRGLLMKFRGVEGVALVDRLDSFFAATVDPETGRETAAARFPAALTAIAGPAAADPAARAGRAAARLARAGEALALLGRLGRRGWDVSAALPTARRGLLEPALGTPAASLLATIGRAEAQAALQREAERMDLPAARREVALAGLTASVGRWGPLLASGEMREVAARYNRPVDEDSRAAAAAVLDVMAAPRRTPEPSPVDAAPASPER